MPSCPPESGFSSHPRRPISRVGLDRALESAPSPGGETKSTPMRQGKEQPDAFAPGPGSGLVVLNPVALSWISIPRRLVCSPAHGCNFRVETSAF